MSVFALYSFKIKKPATGKGIRFKFRNCSADDESQGSIVGGDANDAEEVGRPGSAKRSLFFLTRR
jgi:hypothetical protein